MNLFIASLLFFLWAGLIYFFRRARVWLLYYLVGSTGLAYFLVYIAKELLQGHILLAQSVAVGVHYISNLLNIPTEIFTQAPGLLLVLVVVQQIGWTILEIGVESSGILEMSVLISLVVFYPGWALGNKALKVLIGLTLTWFANVARMVLIIMVLHFFGKQFLVIAHTFLGKAFFFICTIAIYWLLISLPTLKLISKNISAKRGGRKKA